MRSLTAFAASAASVAMLLAVFVGCEDDPRYVYTAQRYDEERGCLEEYSAIETVPGNSVSVRCAPACLMAFGDLYVSPVCPPLPGNAVAVAPDDPACAAALEAARLEIACEADADEDAGEDADLEAGEDAFEGGDGDADTGLTDAGGDDAPDGD